MTSLSRQGLKIVSLVVSLVLVLAGVSLVDLPGAYAGSGTRISGFPGGAAEVPPGTTIPFRIRVKATMHAKRIVQLQVRDEGAQRWVTYVSGRTNRSGYAQVAYLTQPSEAVVRLRVRVLAHRGTSGAVSAVLRLTSQSDPDPVPDPTPTPNPTPDPISDQLAEVLDLVNQARASSRACGETTFPAASSLVRESRLDQAAQKYAQRMATEDFFAHVSPDGTTLVTRVEAEGYGWSRLGENIAAGYSNAEDVMTGWLTSPGHCRNIMGEYSELGLGVARQPGTSSLYWVQVFGVPS